jgi:hypothetical protein
MNNHFIYFKKNCEGTNGTLKPTMVIINPGRALSKVNFTKFGLKSTVTLPEVGAKRRNSHKNSTTRTRIFAKDAVHLGSINDDRKG